MRFYNNIRIFLVCYLSLVMLCFSLFVVSFGIKETKASEFWLDTESESFYEGSGTRSDPYQIENKYHFVYMAQMLEYDEPLYVGASYILMSPINLSGALWMPIPVANSNFYFDGNGNSISEIMLTDDSFQSKNGGIFSTFAGTFLKTTILDMSIYCETPHQVSSIADTNSGTISNCQIINLSIKNNGNSSGICFSNTGSIVDTFVRGEIKPLYSSLKSSYSIKAQYRSKVTETNISGSGNSYTAYHSGLVKMQISKGFQRDPNSFVAGLVVINTGRLSSCYFAGIIENFNINIQFQEDNESTYSCGFSHESGATHNTLLSYGYCEGFRLQFACYSTTQDFAPSYPASVSYAGDDAYNIFLKHSGLRQTSFTCSSESYPLYATNSGTIENCFYYEAPSFFEYDYYNSVKLDDYYKGYTHLRLSESGMKNTCPSSAYEISDYINDGFPHLKNFYWENNTI